MDWQRPDDLDDAERVAILAEYDRVAQDKLPPNVSSCGCPMVVLGVLMFFGFPVLMADRGVPQGAKTFVFVVIIVLVVAGLWFFVRGNRGLREARRRAGDAVAQLERFPALTRDEQRAAAVRALFHAFYTSGGPASATIYSPPEVRERIPAALPYVLAAERVLIAGRGLWPVFTRDEQEK